MELNDIITVNWMYEKFYPYVARQILDEYGRTSGRALEMGAYAPGISAALLALAPDLDVLAAAGQIFDHRLLELESAAQLIVVGDL